MTRFFVIRHGDNDWLGRAMAGRTPGVHLNPHGHLQAQRLADRLAGEKIEHLFASPLERAIETAEPLGKRLNLAVQIAPELNEIDFGEWSGRKLEDFQAHSWWQAFNKFRSGTRIPGGELMIEAQCRVVSLIDRLHGEWADAGIALVSHGDVIRAALMYFLGMPIDLVHRLVISPASVSLVKLYSDSAQVSYVNRTWEE